MRRFQALVLALAALGLASPALAGEPARDAGPRADGEPSADAPVVEEPTLPQWGKGPFEVPDLGLLAVLRLEPFIRSPRTLAPGVVSLGLRSSMENTFSYLYEDVPAPPGQQPPTRITIDGETRDLALVARVGVLPRVELGAELSAVHWQGGGVIDGLIRNWHDLVGVGTLDRNKVHRDSYVFDAREPDGRRVSPPGQLTGLGDGAVSARVLALEGGDLWPAVALSVRAWVPVSNPHFGHARGSAESLQADLSKRVLDLPVVVYAAAAYTYYDECEVGGLHEYRHRFYGAIGAEWEVHRVVSIVAHFFEESPRERKLYRGTRLPYGNFVQYVAFGLELEPIPGLKIETGGMEHIFDPNVTGTFGLLLSVSWEFDAGALLGAKG